MEIEHETPVVEGRPTYGSITDKISSIVLEGPGLGWYLGLGVGAALLLVYIVSLGYAVFRGTGIWGLNAPVGWGFPITSFVWWIGIGHAGTFISATLLLFRARWRTSINRVAEAMTIFALVNALIFPLIHLGRPWLAYWLLPYPNTMSLWPQFRSPLVWDFVAVSSYFLISLLFWYVGLIPDIATLRDRARGEWARRLYGFLAMGWVGSVHDWQRYESTYYVMAALIAPLVIAVHSVSGLIFSASIIPGWHSTIMPPFFAAGQIFAGFALVLVIIIPLRKFFDLGEFITMRHLDMIGKFLLGSGLLVLFGYVVETFAGWYNDGVFEEHIALARLTGPYAGMFWTMFVLNVVFIQALWWKRIRHSPLAQFLIALGVLVGMWIERFLIVVLPISQDFLPSSWGVYRPTFWDWSILAGSVGLFMTLFFLFLRVLPAMSISEVQGLVSEVKDEPEPARVVGGMRRGVDTAELTPGSEVAE